MRTASCISYWDEDFDIWECAVCGFVTRDDEEARNHGLTGAQIYLDSVRASD